MLIWLVLIVEVALAQNIPPQAGQDAYKAAIDHKEVQVRIKALELVLETSASSTLKEEALESLASAYRESGTLIKEQKTLERLFSVNADNLYGLKLRADVMLLGCDSGDCEREMTSIADHGFRVLSSGVKPDYLSDSEFARRKEEAGITFHRLGGLAAVMQQDYRRAQEHFLVLVEANPNELGCVYPLALTYLKSNPPDMTRGLFFLARAAILAPASARPQIEKFGKGEYKKYHGSVDRWQEVLRIAKANQQLPSSFTVTPAPDRRP
jgi:tetratricopeptide (TPR) repeat protein